jgi:hypothetical protein
VKLAVIVPVPVGDAALYERNAGVTAALAEAGPVPTALVAVTEHECAVPLVSPVTVSGDTAPVALSAPGLHVAVYDVTAAPPSFDGGENAIVACAFPGVAVPMRGAPGTVAGVTLFDAADAGPVPRALVAVTLNVYAVPFVRPITAIEVQGAAHVPVMPPGADVAVNEVIADPPSLAGAVNVTVA